MALNTKIKKRRLTSAQVIALGYLFVILLGSLLLSLPFASKARVWTRYDNALFTATSATCVTGLSIADTYLHWSLFGQIVILALIQIGGIGFMTVITLFALFMKRHIGLFTRKIMNQSAGNIHIGGVVTLMKKIIIGTAIFELSGTALLACRFCPQMGFWRGLYNALFHAVSAFCNAGFDLMGKYAENGSLQPYAGDVFVNLVIMSLIVVGGLGFLVWSDIWEKRGNFTKFSLHSKIVLGATAVLIVLPTIFFFFVERRHAYADMSTGQAFLAALFQAVTPRTAGFSTVDQAALGNASSALTMLLMFIGGSPGSTAGGIKTTTIVVILVGMVSIARNKSSVEIGKRSINPQIVRQAFAVFSVYLLCVFISVLTIAAIQPELGMPAVLFEAVSAIGTVGLSQGITAQLGVAAKLIIALLMYIGRVGALSIALALAERKNSPLTRPEEKILVG